MSYIFFVSSAGDTDLAKATIAKLTKRNEDLKIVVVLVAEKAADMTKNIQRDLGVECHTLADIAKQPDILKHKKISIEALQEVMAFVKENNIQRAFVGVPSPLDEEIPFQIAQALSIPCTIAYEYMFTAPAGHRLWHYANLLAEKESCDFAVPLAGAEEDIHLVNNNAKISQIGHLSIDRAFENKSAFDMTLIRQQLDIKDDERFAFISGTTQPQHVDNNFFDALLGELATGKYPNLQLRFGIHPGVANIDVYLNMLLETCAKYPQTKSQCKIILPDNIKARLKNEIEKDHPFVLYENVSGAQAAATADMVGQAVPGALTNEAVIKGQGSYFHEKTKPYLPEVRFSRDISSFFKAQRQHKMTREEVVLITRSDADIIENSAADLCAKIFLR